MILCFNNYLDTADVNSLSEKTARDYWEREFNSLYIQPVLETLDSQLGQVIELVATDDRQGTVACSYVGV